MLANRCRHPCLNLVQYQFQINCHPWLRIEESVTLLDKLRILIGSQEQLRYFPKEAELVI